MHLERQSRSLRDQIRQGEDRFLARLITAPPKPVMNVLTPDISVK